MHCLYLDNNASTPLLPAVADAMRPFLDGLFGNPASAHRLGRQARNALETARELVATLLDASPEEVVFTSGATEANNLALSGQHRAISGQQSAVSHIVASPVEHPSVSEPLRHLCERGFVVSYLPVDESGIVRVEELKGLLRPETGLVAVMLANHETGSIQPLEQIVEIVREVVTDFKSVATHCDAVQAVGKIAVSFRELGVDTLSLSAHKFHGPKGVGALLVRRGSRLAPLFHGGHQQRGLRPGTEPVALAVGLAKALELACQERESRLAHVSALRERLLAGLAEVGPVLNGPPLQPLADTRLEPLAVSRLRAPQREDAKPQAVQDAYPQAVDAIPHTINLSFPGLKADLLLMALDLAGVCCSAGSACSSGSLLPSPVLRAMNLPDSRISSAIRFSLGVQLSFQEIDEAAVRICRVVKRLRQESDSANTSSGAV